MSSGTLYDRSLLWILLLLIISHIALSVDKELPLFVELPPPIQYYTATESTIELKCNVWPSTAKVQFMISTRKSWLGPSQNSVELTPLDRNIGDLISPGKLRISNQIHLNNIQDQNMHCLTATDFATVLSRPFRVTPAVMSDFGGDLTSKSKTSEKKFLIGNVAIVDCWPPESHPRAEIKFNFNNIEIKEGGSYRIVYWPDGKRISLLIHPAKKSDNGQYRCIATNPITRQTKVSSEVTNLIIEEPQAVVSPSIIVSLSGRDTGSQQIEARIGMNVTLFCIMQGAPPPQIQIEKDDNDLTTNKRYTWNQEFGMLTIPDVKKSDEGTYLCSDKVLTSSAKLKVIEPLNFKKRPTSVVMDGLSGSARFECETTRPSVPVQWFFNGRPVTAPMATPPLSVSSDGGLSVPAVTGTSLGVYQCVAQDRDEWLSAAATLSLRSDTLITQPTVTETATDSDLVRPPIVQNIDTQEQILPAPIADRIVDNMAVYVHWKLSQDKLGPVAHYVLQYESKARDEASWSRTNTIQDKLITSYFYMTSRALQPQYTYRFRVHTIFTNGHTITSIWSKDTDFFNVGITSPVIEEASVKSPGTIVVRWSYSGVDVWPVDTFRILYRQSLNNDSNKFGTYSAKDVASPTMNVSLDNLEPGSSYQMIVYGIREGLPGSRSTTTYSKSHTVSLPPVSKIATTPVSSSTTRFFAGLWESWKSNKLLYGSLFALTGFLIIVMFLLLLLCLCRQRRFRNNKDTSSSHTFPYAYKEVSKASSAANNNNSSTLQMPGRMPQYSSQLALQQFQPNNNGSIDRRNMDTASQIHRAGSSQAMDTASLVSDLYNPNYMHGMPMSHMQQHPYQGFSTLPQGYQSSHHNKNNPQYQHFLQQQQQQQQQHHHHQQQQAHMGSMRRENPTGDSNRDSLIDQSMEMPPRGMSASQQQLMAMQNQEQQQQRLNMGYYSGARQGAMSPQMMMMMGSQQSLGPYAPYRRSNSQNYPGQMETPIGISASGHPVYQMDQVLVDAQGRPLSPQYQYMQQQQHQGSMHPSMLDMYNQSQGYIRPGTSEYSQHSLYRQQYRRSGSDSGTGVPEPGYAYLPTGHGPEIIAAARQHALNSLPEQPADLGNGNQPHHQDSPSNTATNNSNNNSSGRHHHRRKTRNRPQNSQDNPSLERVQANHGDILPMLAPRSKMPYTDNPSHHRLSGQDMNPGDCQELSINDCNSESNTTGDNFEPPLQYSTHYDPHDPNDNESNPILIDNLPRIRDVSEYGIPVNGNPSSANNNINISSNGHNQRPLKHQQQQQQHHQAPVPPLKSTSRHNVPLPNNGYNIDCTADYYSSATSSDRSGPSPPPKYAPGTMPIGRPDDVYMKNLYYHGDTHC